MKKPNTQVRRNGGSKTVSPQASTKPEPASAEQGSHPHQTVPSWLKIEHLAILNVLASNRSKFALTFRSIAALAREFKVELDQGNDCILACFAELGWLETPGRDHWRITPAGRDVLQTFTHEAAVLAHGGAR